MRSGRTHHASLRRNTVRRSALVCARLLSLLTTVVRDYLCIIGLEVVALAYFGSRDANLFPFYVDADLVGHALVASAVATVIVLALRMMSGRIFDPLPHAPID